MGYKPKSGIPPPGVSQVAGDSGYINGRKEGGVGKIPVRVSDQALAPCHAARVFSCQAWSHNLLLNEPVAGCDLLLKESRHGLGGLPIHPHALAEASLGVVCAQGSKGRPATQHLGVRDGVGQASWSQPCPWSDKGSTFSQEQRKRKKAAGRPRGRACRSLFPEANLGADGVKPAAAGVGWSVTPHLGCPPACCLPPAACLPPTPRPTHQLRAGLSAPPGAQEAPPPHCFALFPGILHSLPRGGSGNRASKGAGRPPPASP